MVIFRLSLHMEGKLSTGAFFTFTCHLCESTQSKFATQYACNSGISWIRTKIGFLGEKNWGFSNKNTKILKLEESSKFDVKYIQKYNGS